MEHLAAFMLLVGCSNGTATCQEIPVPVPMYQTVENCRRDLQLQMRLSDSRDERVYGACKPITPAVFEGSGTLDWAIDRAGQLIIDFQPQKEQIVASR